MMRVKWKPIPGWEKRYAVSNFGHVMNVQTGKLRKTPKGGPGYPMVTLKAAGRKQESHCVHALVACAFIGPRPEGADVMHLDGSRDNNRLDNLRYGSRSENNTDKVAHGTDNRGTKHYGAKLTEELVREIRDCGFTDRQWAEHLGVSRQTVQEARTGKTWAHLDGQVKYVRKSVTCPIT